MRVLITRPRDQAASFAAKINNIGLDVIFFPTIEIKPVEDTASLDTALSHIDDYDWLVLTSANAVDALIGRLMDLGIDSLPNDLKVAVVGSKTADRLKVAGIQPDFIPERHLSEAILPGLGDLQEQWVLLPAADIAPDLLPNAIQEAGGIVHVVTAYHTVPVDPDPDGLSAIEQGVDYITFTSGSTVRNFYSLLASSGLEPLHLPGNPTIVCIGPKTKQAALDLGFKETIVAEPHTTDGLIAAIRSQLPKKATHDK